jgi:hypothetical protein
VTPDLRTLRLRGVWLLIVPFVLLARPTPGLLALGGVVAALGVGVRGWAAGIIRKDRELTMTGPYAHTRNPLYLGSFLIGLGVTLAGGRAWLMLFFGLFFAVVYGAVMRAEARALALRFGDSYEQWAGEVPAFVPRISPYRGGAVGAGSQSLPGFTFDRWRRNREYEAVLGVIAGFAFLVVKLLFR